MADDAVSSGGADGVLPGWEIVVGLEVHCELKTRTKLFCGCANSFGQEPNTSICPVCLGLPGSLPVINKQAVELAIRIGLSLNCTVDKSIFHRKNYFYPDMPKDYQVSQYEKAINENGFLELPLSKKVVRIERAHIEEDTGKSMHVGGDGGRIHGAVHSLVDYNRAGIPLVEIVSAPDLRSAEEAREYVTELRSILVASAASDGKMEEGSLRVDANVSVRRLGVEEFGTRCEIKNLNSLRSLVRAIGYEARRQVALIESGEKVVQQTRHWNEDQGVTTAMRSKEEAYDYRYFPEPDLVPLEPSAEWVTEIRSHIGLLPASRRERLTSLFNGVSSGPVYDQIVTAVGLGLDDLVAGAVAKGAEPRLALARATNEVASDLGNLEMLTVDNFTEAIRMESEGKLSATQAKTVLGKMLESGANAREVAKSLGFEAMDSTVIEGLVDQVIRSSPKEWERFSSGEDQLAGFFVGQVMKLSKGKADGKIVTSILRSRRS
ncbi:MAG: Asp-tRNA(Asn)/Glu-tRNA(Gln) amidotransferase subunit GatB [Actinomycetota bacterium]|nr:MAG: Asp-tRNA(Asn)/Glu-tRNA(Gln) amidotransferase subunit GatB [Actinomycetota bacterium]